MTKEKQLDGSIRKYKKVVADYDDVEMLIGKKLEYVNSARIKMCLEFVKHRVKIEEMVDSLDRYFHLSLKIELDEIEERVLGYMGYEQTTKELDEIEERELDKKKNLFQTKEKLKQEKERLIKEIGLLAIKERRDK